MERPSRALLSATLPHICPQLANVGLGNVAPHLPAFGKCGTADYAGVRP
jgi:hypothetical protein